MYVDDFDLSSSSCGFGRKTQARRTVDGHAFSVCGASFERGFGAHPEGAVAFRSNGRVAAFDARVALDDDSTNAVPYRAAQKAYGGPEAVFKVWADGKVVWKSEPIHPGEKPVPVHVDLSGAEEIILETCGGNVWYDFAAVNADWLDARFTCEADATLKVADDPGLYAQLGVLTPPEAKEPRINGADIWGVRPGRPVIFRVATSGERPMKFSAARSPARCASRSRRLGLAAYATSRICGGRSARASTSATTPRSFSRTRRSSSKPAQSIARSANEMRE